MAEERAPRRLTTILAADVAGYARLVAAEEESALRTLNSHRAIIDRLITRHEGRIFATAGDSVVAEFGSAVEAVRCATSIQEELRVRNAELAEDRRMLFRIGINVGDVMIDGDNLFGDGVNIAARLEGIAEPGGIYISGSTFDQVKNRLSIGFEALGPQAVKNTPDPVPTYRLVPGPVSVAPAAPGLDRAMRRRATAALAALVVLCAVAGGLAWWQGWAPETRAFVAGVFGGPRDAASPEQATPETVPPRLSIIVIPFDNLSGDPAHGKFADSITENLITELSQKPDFTVIARSASLAYKGKANDLMAVTGALNVRYALEGSVQQSDDLIRVNAKLIHGETGAQIMSERFDHTVTDVLRVQTQIVNRIAQLAELTMVMREGLALRALPAERLDAAENALLADATFRSRPRDLNMTLPEKVIELRRLLERAIELDPDNKRAWLWLMRHNLSIATNWPTPPGLSKADDRKGMLVAARKLVLIDPGYFAGHQALGMAYRLNGEFDKAELECDIARELRPSAADPHHCLGLIAIVNGRFPEAISHLQEALSLQPYGNRVRRIGFLGLALILGGRHEAAVEVLAKAAALAPRRGEARIYLASALALSGQADEAKRMLGEATKREQARDFTIEKFRVRMRGLDTPKSNIEHLLNGLRLAGMPEQ